MTRGEGTFAQLQLERYTAHAALNAESGWCAADESTPDAIILNLGMPLVDGRLCRLRAGSTRYAGT